MSLRVSLPGKPFTQGRLILLLALHLRSPQPAELHSLILQCLSSELVVASEKKDRQEQPFGFLFPVSCTLFTVPFFPPGPRWLWWGGTRWMQLYHTWPFSESVFIICTFATDIAFWGLKLKTKQFLLFFHRENKLWNLSILPYVKDHSAFHIYLD